MYTHYDKYLDGINIDLLNLRYIIYICDISKYILTITCVRDTFCIYVIKSIIELCEVKRFLNQNEEKNPPELNRF